MNIEGRRGPGTFRVEKQIPADQARREFENSLRQQGAVEFSMAVGETEQRVVALPEVVGLQAQGGEIETRRPVLQKAQGELSKERPEMQPDVDRYVVVHGSGFDFGEQHYRLDLLDAPDELREAIQNKWDTIITNEKVLGADGPKDAVAEIQRDKTHYAEIIAAIEASNNTPDAFPAESPVPYDHNRMKRLPADDQIIFASYRKKGWARLGGRQRAHYQELRARLEQAPENVAAA